MPDLPAAALKRYAGPGYFAANAVALGLLARRAGGTPAMSLAGGLLAHGGPVGFLASALLSGKGRTSREAPWLRAAVAAGTVATVADPRRRPGRMAATLALAAAGTEVYLRWYSVLDRGDTSALAVGRRLPDDISFVDHHGTAVRPEDLRGRPTAVFFSRGNWCPFCVAQVKEMAERWQELEAMGVGLVVVMAQDEAHNRELAERFDVGFRYLSDPGLEAARRLGIFHEGGTPPGTLGYEADAMFPTILVLDADGRIVFSDQTDNYRVRPDPETVVAALRDAAGAAPATAPPGVPVGT